VNTLSARENVELPIQLDAHPRFRASTKASELLESFGLSQRGSHKPAELSGGEQQRVAIARAMANDPSVIFADEPTGNLDTKNGAAVVASLKDLNQKRGKTLIIVTHDQRVAGQCHRILHLLDGRFVSDGHPDRGDDI